MYVCMYVCMFTLIVAVRSYCFIYVYMSYTAYISYTVYTSTVYSGKFGVWKFELFKMQNILICKENFENNKINFLKICYQF